MIIKGRGPNTANLLVVLLLVGNYNLVRDGARQILSRTRPARPPASQARGLQPRGHDWLWILGPTLATD
jgi:hypothetical protein